MSTTSPPVALALGVLDTIQDPTAQYGAPAKRVQIQNASPFIITATIDGETFNLQSFTAQTLPTAGSGASLLILPTGGPAGSQGSLTAVWLNATEDPPMTDGQLTGAAQYAQGLGSTLANFGQFAPSAGTAAFDVTLAPTTRTLLIKALGSTTNFLTNVRVRGDMTSIDYYNQPPYLFRLSLAGPNYLVVIPVPSVVDPSVTVTLTYLNNGVIPAGGEVVGDTAQYDESVFYNGPVTAASAGLSAAGTTTVITGPARLLTLQGQNSGTEAVVQINGQDLLNLAVATAAINFPRRTILQAGEAMTLTQVGAGFSFANLSYAFP